MQNKKNALKNIVIGYLLVAVCIGTLSYNYLASKKDKAFTQMNLEYFAFTFPDEADITDNPDGENTDGEIIEGGGNSGGGSGLYYIGTLEIPVIGLTRGLVDPTSPDNTVEKNVEIVKGSDMPDIQNGNLILAAHSGNSYIAYFRELYRANKGDFVYVTYNGIKYTYKITDIYFQNKTGQIGIYRDYGKTTLTLVTCTKDSDEKQTIYIAELVSKN